MNDDDLRQIEALIKKHTRDCNDGLGCIAVLVFLILIVMVSCRH